MSKIIFSKEEKLINSVLFKGKIDFNINDVNWEKIIKITSSHLVIPAFYYNSQKRNILKKFPNDFRNYIEKIFDLNLNRNTILKEEIDQISKLFRKEKINHAFFKGSSLLLNGFFENIGERMISDIDILIPKADKEKAIRLLNKNMYFNNYGYVNWKTKADTNFVNTEKLFGIDLHTNLFNNSDEYLMNINLMLEEIKKT